jgi:hypothetical protein
VPTSTDLFVHRLRWGLFLMFPMAVLQCEVSGDLATPRSGDACEIDDDCGLVPGALTCCGECPPAPPFQAVPRTQLDAMLLELELACAQPTIVGDEQTEGSGAIACLAPPACEPVPAGCVARAACRDGRCVVIARGCAPRVSSVQPATPEHP